MTAPVPLSRPPSRTLAITSRTSAFTSCSSAAAPGRLRPPMRAPALRASCVEGSCAAQRSEPCTATPLQRVPLLVMALHLATKYAPPGGMSSLPPASVRIWATRMNSACVSSRAKIRKTCVISSTTRLSTISSISVSSKRSTLSESPMLGLLSYQAVYILEPFEPQG
jgi:hypothetical protein